MTQAFVLFMLPCSFFLHQCEHRAYSLYELAKRNNSRFNTLMPYYRGENTIEVEITDVKCKAKYGTLTVSKDLRPDTKLFRGHSVW